MVRRRLFLVMVCGVAMALGSAAAAALEIGEQGPDFTLAGIDGKIYSLGTFKDAKNIVVVFTCNHCPVAIAYEDRLIELAKSYKDKGVALVAINSNDADVSPQDSFDKMLKRAKDKKLPYPYVFDADQSVAKGYDAKCTPHVFVLDKNRKLAYTGGVDDDQKPKRVKERWLADALDALLAGNTPKEQKTAAFGCSIKWKPKK